MSRKKIWEKKKKFPKENHTIKKKNIKSLQKLGLIREGVFIGNPRGFGFVETGEEEEDIFIPAEGVNTALHQDKVQVLLKKDQKPGKRREGAVLKILERGTVEVVGTFQREGDYGFVVCDNQKISKDIYISPKNSQGIRVLKILERGTVEVVGTFQREGDYGFVVCDNQKISKDIYISPKNSQGIRDGEKVVATILDYGSQRKKPEGKIVESLGNMHAPGTDILALVKSFNIPSEFPVRVQNQAMRVPDHVLEGDRNGRTDLTDLVTVTIDGEDAKDLDDAVSLTKENGQAMRVPDHVLEGDRNGRTDLTDLVTVTIDGEDAKDLDDAVSLTKENGIYHLGVHIADVSNYVQGGSALDKEALKRGTSVYLADRVIPMLPERLSNGICSLNQGVDRLTLSCLMDIDEKGNVVDHKITESIIRVDRRMSYEQVRCILEDGDTETKREHEEFVPMFFLMKELSVLLRSCRHHRGSVNFDFPESKIILNGAGRAIDVKPYETSVATEIIEDVLLRSCRHHRGSVNFDFPESKIILNGAGRAIDVKPYETSVATEIIEDFMLLANETVAKEYCKGEYPFVYRLMKIQIQKRWRSF